MLNEDVLRLLDNDGKLLYLLFEMGPQRFEEIVDFLNPFEKLEKSKSPNSSPSKGKKTTQKKNPKYFMSRGTISKRLKYLKDPSRKFIDQFSEMDPLTNRNVQKYQITDKGKAFLTQLIKTEQISVLQISSE